MSNALRKNTSRTNRYFQLIIPLLFLVFSAPVALNYLFTHADEKYYVNAAIMMLQNNDYMTPYTGDEALRFNKPIVTYLLMAASYNLFGVSPFSSRLPFLIGGAVIILLTGKIAAMVFHNQSVSRNAMIVLLVNPLLLQSATRSIPDIPLTLFLTMSAYGFLGILLEEKPSKRFYWMAYIGTALAFETKGLPAAAFACTSILYLLVNPWNRKSLKSLIHPPSILTSLIIACGWFVLMYSIHGHHVLEKFYTDQVGERVLVDTMKIMTNLWQFTLVFSLYFLPWLIPLSMQIQQGIYINKYKYNSHLLAVCVYVLFMLILFFGMSAFVGRFFDRYFLPVLPIVSIMLAHAYTQIPGNRQYRYLLPFSLIYLFVTIVFLFLTGYHISRDLLTINQLLITLSVGLTIILSVILLAKKSDPAIPLMLLFLSLSPAAYVATAPIFLPDTGHQTKQTLETIGIKKTLIGYYGPAGISSVIRVACGPETRIVNLDSQEPADLEKYDCILFEEKSRPAFNTENYRISTVSLYWKKIDAGKLLKAIHNNQIEQVRIDQSGKIMIAYKPVTS